MMFDGDLYTLMSRTCGSCEAEFVISLNVGCDIFKGHFPGSPITPGACMLQIAVELCGNAFGCKCSLTGCKNLKFLQVIDPSEHPQVRYRLSWLETEDPIRNVKIEVSDGETVFSKMNVEVKLK